jgi:DNA polymerase-3 subunit gamma/tau
LANAYRVLARNIGPDLAELISEGDGYSTLRTRLQPAGSARRVHPHRVAPGWARRRPPDRARAQFGASARTVRRRDGAPCGVCANCRQIAEDRYSDVVEMDAASRTGVDDIRELTEGLLYRKPDLGRYRVYIIDEVHMLSRNAFNALLKTLEEPPPHAKFVFATTEIQKVPLTVLSRCQRFSLRRVPVEILAEHYRRIAEAEVVEADPAALALIARAADGSVRDWLSLLDQAIALTDGKVTETAARDMLGVADRGRVFDLLESVLAGDAAAALDRLDRLYQDGADPLMV